MASSEVPDNVAATADVAPSAVIARTATVWHLAQVRERAVLGEQVVIGRGAYIGIGVRVASHAKVQNYALVYEPAELESGVFIGPAAVLTNDRFPRSVNPDGSQKVSSDWEPVGVYVEEGASVGARAVCVAPLRIGKWAMIAAGAVVSGDVAAFALVAGVPARRLGWVGRAGARLVRDEGESDRGDSVIWRCPVTGDVYHERNGNLEEGIR